MLENCDDFLTVEEFCETLKIGRNAAYALLCNGKVKAFRNGRVWRIPKQAVVEYVYCEKVEEVVEELGERFTKDDLIQLKLMEA